MPMRTDEQRDHCIDVLLTRVMTLETEVARLKGEPLTEENLTAQQNTELSTSPSFPFSKIERKTLLNKPADSSLENAIGTRWIGRIGVLAILFGIAFFLKYSFDNKLIGETGRVMLGIFWGAAFIGAGEYLQKKKNMGLYGQMLSGGGLAVLYLALYAGFRALPSDSRPAGISRDAGGHDHGDDPLDPIFDLFSGCYRPAWWLSDSNHALHRTKPAPDPVRLCSAAGHQARCCCSASANGLHLRQPLCSARHCSIPAGTRNFTAMHSAGLPSASSQCFLSSTTSTS